MSSIPSTTPPSAPVGSPRQRFLGPTLDLIARSGVRGATMRDIAKACDANVATISNLFENKEGLVAECFAAAALADAAYLDDLIAQARALQPSAVLLAPFLWSLVEDAAGVHRNTTLVLTELWLNAPSNPRYVEICRTWLTARRDAFHDLADIFAAPPLALEALCLYLLTETSFALSGFGSIAYRLNANLLLSEVVARLAGRSFDSGQAEEISRLSTAFYAEPDPDQGHAQTGQALQARSRESRAKIIRAAAAIIEEAGLAAVTNRAVAERAGVSLALTTYHFSSVNELAFFGTLAVFQSANRVLEADGAAPHSNLIRSRADVVARLKKADGDTGVERVRNRGMIEIALAAAREPAFGELGLGMRRQRGTITFSATRELEGGGPSRALAAGYALWSSAAYLSISATGGGEPIFDLAQQAELTAGRLLRP